MIRFDAKTIEAGDQIGMDDLPAFLTIVARLDTFVRFRASAGWLGNATYAQIQEQLDREGYWVKRGENFVFLCMGNPLQEPSR